MRGKPQRKYPGEEEEEEEEEAMRLRAVS